MTAPRWAAKALLLAVIFCGGGAAAAEPASTPKDLAAALRAIVDGSPIAGARAGVLVTDVESGEVLYERDADVLLNPASNVKLVTSAAALARLGPAYRFDTEFLVDGNPGLRTLYVRGKGDPSLVTERLWAIAGDLQHVGLRRIGDIVLDEGFFDAERRGPGYDQEDGDRSYLAPAGAVSLNWNTVAVHVGPGDRRGARGRVELEPGSDYFEVENRTTTVAARARRRVEVSSTSARGHQRIVVSGKIPLGSRVQVVWRRIDEPGLYFGHTLAKLLELRGVKVTGRVRSGPVAQGARLVHVAESDMLADIVRRLNKTSNNFVAEQLLKTVGAQVKGAPGSWAKGVEAVQDFLAEIGVPRGAYVMRNGSGLNDTNRLSARQLVAVLRAMWARFPLQPEYLASLPVAGRDGTIRYRMEGTEAEGRLRAKTGTLDHVTSLSGYVQTAARRTLAFSIMVNDYAGRPHSAVRAVDALGSAIAASGGAPAELSAAVASAKPPSQVVPAAAPADLAASLHTYYGLGRAGDPRNVPFLRTALRAESDPALKLAIAECVYLSDPDGETSRRTFLEAISPDAHSLGRLWAALATDDPPPVLSSLADLAGEGDPDALARLLELAPAAGLDGRLASAIGDALAAAASSAPEELVETLRAAPAALVDPALSALAGGLGRLDEPDPTFENALRALAAKDGGDLAAFARALAPRLQAALEARKAIRAQPTLAPAAQAPARAPAAADEPAQPPGPTVVPAGQPAAPAKSR